MTKKRMLILFTAAGLILAAVFGVYFYRANLTPGPEKVTPLLQDFTEKIASGDLDGARQLMTEETGSLLREPGTVLGEKVYSELKLRSVGKVYGEGNGAYAADVILTVPDTLKIMATAGILFGEKIAEEGPAEDPDLVLSDIYAQILSRDDIPMLDNFCVVRLETRNGRLLISGDEALQQALEGNAGQNSELFRSMMESSR